MKKILLVLLVFLTLNFGLRAILRIAIGDNGYHLEDGIEITYKVCLIIGLLFVIYKSKVQLTLWNKKYIFLGICVVLGYLAVHSISDQTAEIPIQDHVLYLVSCLSVAVFEEYLFRVYVFDGLSKVYDSKKLVRVILVTSLLFAVAHGTNALQPGAILYGVIVQIFFAFGIGILFQSLLIRFKNVLLVIVLHTIVNYLGAYKSQLLHIERISEQYTFEDFLMSLGIFTGFTVLFILPISYALIIPYIKTKKSTSAEDLV